MDVHVSLHTCPFGGILVLSDGNTDKRWDVDDVVAADFSAYFLLSLDLEDDSPELLFPKEDTKYA